MTPYDSDPMDRYSKPVQVKEMLLATVFRMEARRKPEKPGRALVVTYDERMPLAREFRLRYSYVVRFDRAGDASGNHFHRKNTELLLAVHGTFDIHLEDPGTKKHEAFQLRADKHEAVLIAPGIAHRIVSRADGAIIIGHSSGAHTEADEVAYRLF